MTPDLKRLCDAAKIASHEAPDWRIFDDRAEAIVRAVLTALRKPSDHIWRLVADDVTGGDPNDDFTPSAAKEAVNVMIDIVLDEKAFQYETER